MKYPETKFKPYNESSLCKVYPVAESSISSVRSVQCKNYARATENEIANGVVSYERLT